MSGVVSYQELISIIKCILGHNEVVLKSFVWILLYIYITNKEHENTNKMPVPGYHIF